MNAFISHHIFFALFASWVILMSCVTLFLFAWDKMKSIKGSQKRVSEKTLLIFCAWGGSVGGLIGIYALRHKSKHFYFPLIAWQSLIIHSLVLILVF